MLTGKEKQKQKQGTEYMNLWKMYFLDTWEIDSKDNWGPTNEVYSPAP